MRFTVYPRVALIVALIILVLAAEWAWLRHRRGAAPEPGIAAHAAVPGGPFALTDHTGRAAGAQDFHGRILLLTFGYTGCADICPTVLQHLAAVMDLLDPADPVTPLFVSLDPARDTPEVLAGYVAAFHPGIVGLTGDQAVIGRLAKAYRVNYARHGTEDDYLIDHSAAIYLIGRDGKPVRYFRPETAPAAIAAALRRLLAARS